MKAEYHQTALCGEWHCRLVRIGWKSWRVHELCLQLGAGALHQGIVVATTFEDARLDSAGTLGHEAARNSCQQRRVIIQLLVRWNETGREQHP